MSQETPEHDTTRERILDEAEKLFSEKGFAAVSVREITTAAHCHLAAVNYHFGSKKDLYLDVFRHRWLPRAKNMRARIEALAANGQPSAEEIVRGVTQNFFSAFASEQERRRHTMLMMREIAQPGEALELVVKEAIRPNFELMVRLLRPHLNPQIDTQRIILNLFSIFAQVIYFNMARLPITRATGRDYDDAFVAELVDHITSFCLNGLPLISKEEVH